MRTIALLSAILLLTALIVSGCGSSGPSDEDIQQTILEYVHNYTAYALFFEPYKPYVDVREVEVIKVGESYKISDGVNEINVWPVKVYLLKPTSKVEAEFDIAQDPYGDWKVIWDYLYLLE